MSQYMFGTGQLFATPVGGGNPLRLGALQDVLVDFSGDIKQLYGQYQFPLDVARGKTKIEGKCSTANIDVAAWNQLFFGGTVTNNAEKRQVTNEAGSIPATPFQITVANASDFFMDLGVTDITTGAPYKQVAAGPTTGQYSVNSATGVYTFAAADTLKNVLINYIYDATTAGSGSLTIGNNLMGSTPKFQLVMSQMYNNKQFLLMLYSCTSDKLSMPLKQDDYMIPELSYQAQANDANQIGFISTTSAVGGGS